MGRYVILRDAGGGHMHWVTRSGRAFDAGLEPPRTTHYDTYAMALQDAGDMARVSYTVVDTEDAAAMAEIHRRARGGEPV